MSLGERAKLTCTADYAYGASGVGGVYPSKRTTSFRVEFVLSTPILDSVTNQLVPFPDYLHVGQVFLIVVSRQSDFLGNQNADNLVPRLSYTELHKSLRKRSEYMNSFNHTDSAQP